MNQPLAAIAKREETIYVCGQEDEPIALDHHSPVLHLVQVIRDEAHRFAVGFHRKRREMRDRDSELLAIPGIGARTRQRLLQHFAMKRIAAGLKLLRHAIAREKQAFLVAKLGCSFGVEQYFVLR